MFLQSFFHRLKKYLMSLPHLPTSANFHQDIILHIQEDHQWRVRLMHSLILMWFRRPEFDRICWLHTDGSVRGGITWDDICRLELPIPPIEKQLEIVNSYKAITERIALKKKINDNLEATEPVKKTL